MAGGYGMRGGYGMQGGMQGGQQQEYGLHRKWVSDEAIACVNLAQMQNSAGQAQGGMPMGGMGMGMAGMGMQGGMQQQPQAPTKSVIFEYLKKRAFFMVVLAICMVVLMSSVFTDCGINLAELGIKVLNKFNGEISNVNP